MIERTQYVVVAAGETVIEERPFPSAMIFSPTVPIPHWSEPTEMEPPAVSVTLVPLHTSPANALPPTFAVSDVGVVGVWVQPATLNEAVAFALLAEGVNVVEALFALAKVPLVAVHLLNSYPSSGVAVIVTPLPCATVPDVGVTLPPSPAVTV